MFFRGYSILNTMARPEALPSPLATGPAKEFAQAGAHLAMSRDLPDMRLSQRLSDPGAYRRLQRGRRQALEALMAVESDAPRLERVTDLICMIAEESAWAENAKGVPFDDDQHPRIDFQCAETAMLLAWVCRAMGERLGPRVTAKLQYEARRRVFSPFLAHADYPFMRFVGPGSAQADRPLCILSDILLSAVLLETDAGRRAAVMKQALRLIDQAVEARNRRTVPLADALAETAAVSDLCLLLRKLTRGQLDLTEVYPTPDWLDALLIPWLEDGFFVDPASGSMRPALSGQALFRVGLASGDEALTALGAVLHRAARVPSPTVTGRMLDQACMGMLSAQADKPPRLKHGATVRNRLMLSRFSGMTCALHTGGDRANAGCLALFADGTPILVETPDQASLPLIGGIAQLKSPGENTPEAAFGADVCPADFETRPERDLMSVDLTHAWPASVGARSIQRTVMVLRQDEMLRLVDAFDLDNPSTVTFRFITPQAPEMLKPDGATVAGVRLGPIVMTWEGDMRCKITVLDERFPTGPAEGKALHCVALTPPKPVGRGFFAFHFMRNQ